MEDNIKGDLSESIKNVIKLQEMLCNKMFDELKIPTHLHGIDLTRNENQALEESFKKSLLKTQTLKNRR